jgi:hypothetical protein
MVVEELAMELPIYDVVVVGGRMSRSSWNLLAAVSV